MLIALAVLIFNMLMLAVALGLAPRSAGNVTLAHQRDFWL